jgi:hypothetical protein
MYVTKRAVVNFVENDSVYIHGKNWWLQEPNYPSV